MNQFIEFIRMMKDPDKIAHRIINVAWGGVIGFGLLALSKFAATLHTIGLF